MRRHGRRSSIKQALFHFRQSAQIIADIVIATTAQCPIKGSSKSFSGIGFEQGPSQVLGFLRDFFQGLGMGQATGVPPSGGRSNCLGDLCRTSLNQIDQHATCQEETFVSLSDIRKYRNKRDDMMLESAKNRCVGTIGQTSFLCFRTSNRRRLGRLPTVLGPCVHNDEVTKFGQSPTWPTSPSPTMAF
jgi:hypothetical protein